MKNKPSQMLFFCLCFLFFVVNSRAGKLVSALYVFGDSTLDAGNVNSTRPISALPYGVDFPGKSSGRLTNGYTMADFFAEWLGLEQLPLPIMELYNNNKGTNNFTKGFNYALRGAGILNETIVIARGAKITPPNMGQQVKQFRRSVEEYLPTQFTSQQALSNHLSCSIFMVSIGGNDYMLRYLPSFRIPGMPNAAEFARKLVDQLAIYLQEMYRLGARRFIVNELGPIGNLPISKIAPPVGLNEEQLNQLALIYNVKLKAMLNQLASSLQSSTFVHLKTFHLASDLIRNPSKYGVKNSKSPCCKITKTGGCELNSVPCSNRTEYVFFDAIHPSEITNKIIAQSCFDGTSGICIPSIKKLAEMNSNSNQETKKMKNLFAKLFVSSRGSSSCRE